MDGESSPFFLDTNLMITKALSSSKKLLGQEALESITLFRPLFSHLGHGITLL